MKLPELMKNQLIFPRKSYIRHNKIHTQIFSKINLKFHCTHDIKWFKCYITLCCVALRYIILLCIEKHNVTKTFQGWLFNMAAQEANVRKRQEIVRKRMNEWMNRLMHSRRKYRHMMGLLKCLKSCFLVVFLRSIVSKINIIYLFCPTVCLSAENILSFFGYPNNYKFCK